MSRSEKEAKRAALRCPILTPILIARPLSTFEKQGSFSTSEELCAVLVLLVVIEECTGAGSDSGKPATDKVPSLLSQPRPLRRGRESDEMRGSGAYYKPSNIVPVQNVQEDSAVRVHSSTCLAREISAGPHAAGALWDRRPLEASQPGQSDK